MSCWCGAGYATVSDCPRCKDDVEELPDGPDELLDALVMLEKACGTFYGRREGDGRRQCRFCAERIDAGPTPGYHEACIPTELPEGARSCTGCAEMILDAEDDLDHDYCDYPGDSRYDEESEPTEPMLELPASGSSPLKVSDQFQCPCTRWLPFELVSPEVDCRRLLTPVVLDCPCGIRICLVWSWARCCVTSVRIERGERLLS